MATNIGTTQAENGTVAPPATIEVTGSYRGRTATHRLEQMADGGWTCMYRAEDWISAYGLARADIIELGAQADRLGRPVALLVRGVNPDVLSVYQKMPPRSIRVGGYDKGARELRLEVLPAPEENAAGRKNH